MNDKTEQAHRAAILRLFDASRRNDFGRPGARITAVREDDLLIVIAHGELADNVTQFLQQQDERLGADPEVIPKGLPRDGSPPERWPT